MVSKCRIWDRVLTDDEIKTMYKYPYLIPAGSEVLIIYKPFFQKVKEMLLNVFKGINK